MNQVLRLCAVCIPLAAAVVLAAPQPPFSFSETLYPALIKAGCQNCHNPNGVSSGTKLQFPEEGAARQRVEAFGRSLVGLVDRQHADQSLLWNKPTNRIKHTGGERIKQGGAEEALLKKWIAYLASMTDAEVKHALLYKSTEAGSYGSAPEVVLRRLTHRQYANTVRDLLHEPTDVTTHFAPEDFVDGFKNQYQAQSLSPTLIEAYSQEAERLADNAFRRGDSRRLVPCDYRGPKEAGCRTEFIRTFGRKAFRRPLHGEELARYEGIFRKETSFLSGARAVVEAMLQAPSFLFWMDTTPRAEWTAYATASRLSYFLWNSTPDDVLLASAASGELDTPAGVEKTAKRMLLDPKAKQGLDEFVTQWLRFDRALDSARERRTFPMFSRELVTAMTEEAKRFVGDLVWNNRNFMDAFRANYGFVNSDLAAVYGVTAPSRDFDRVDFPPEHERAGLLGQALFLTLTSKPEDTAPTARGLFVREQFLCQQVPPPPPGVDTNLPTVNEDRPVTNRERLASHTTNVACASCHSLIDPIGFGLEKFDAIGVRREKMKMLFYPDVHEAKVPKKVVELDLDLSGQLAGVPNSQFTNSRQLGEILAASDLCQECVVKQLFRYMSGRHETRADAPRIRRSLEDFRRSDFRLQELLISLIKGTGRFESENKERSAHGERHHEAR